MLFNRLLLGRDLSAGACLCLTRLVIEIYCCQFMRFCLKVWRLHQERRTSRTRWSHQRPIHHAAGSGRSRRLLCSGGWRTSSRWTRRIDGLCRAGRRHRLLLESLTPNYLRSLEPPDQPILWIKIRGGHCKGGARAVKRPSQRRVIRS